MMPGLGQRQRRTLAHIEAHGSWHPRKSADCPLVSRWEARAVCLNLAERGLVALDAAGAWVLTTDGIDWREVAA